MQRTSRKCGWRSLVQLAIGSKPSLLAHCAGGGVVLSAPMLDRPVVVLALDDGLEVIDGYADCSANLDAGYSAAANHPVERLL